MGTNFGCSSGHIAPTSPSKALTEEAGSASSGRTRRTGAMRGNGSRELAGSSTAPDGYCASSCCELPNAPYAAARPHSRLLASYARLPWCRPWPDTPTGAASRDCRCTTRSRSRPPRPVVRRALAAAGGSPRATPRWLPARSPPGSPETWVRRWLSPLPSGRNRPICSRVNSSGAVGPYVRLRARR